MRAPSSLLCLGTDCFDHAETWYCTDDHQTPPLMLVVNVLLCQKTELKCFCFLITVCHVYEQQQQDRGRKHEHLMDWKIKGLPGPQHSLPYEFCRGKAECTTVCSIMGKGLCPMWCSGDALSQQASPAHWCVKPQKRSGMTILLQHQLVWKEPADPQHCFAWPWSSPFQTVCFAVIYLGI